MKKFFVLLVVVINFFVISNVSAGDISSLPESAQLVYQTFLSDYYDSSKPYCIFDKSTRFYCWNEIPIYGVENDTLYYTKQFSPNCLENYARFYDDASIRRWSEDMNCTEGTYDILYAWTNFDVYDETGFNLIHSADYTFQSLSPSFVYTIEFNLPAGSTVSVYDSNHNEIQATSQYTYELEAGNYTYNASNNLYLPATNVPFSVSGDATINVTFRNKIQIQPVRSIFTQFYNYISVLVSDVFDTENPLFLYIVSFIIGFSIITLIKRLIGGR